MYILNVPGVSLRAGLYSLRSLHSVAALRVTIPHAVMRKGLPAPQRFLRTAGPRAGQGRAPGFWLPHRYAAVPPKSFARRPSDLCYPRISPMGRVA